jgi:hypothetical protein
MEQEPVYVPSGKCIAACQEALGRIYDIRQRAQEMFVSEAVRQWNNDVAARNHKRRWRIKFFGATPESFLTPHGLELQLKASIESLPAEIAQNHPMIQIHRQYDGLEHDAKQAIIMAKMTDSVPFSAQFCSGLSHLGIDMSTMKRMPFGFVAPSP